MYNIIIFGILVGSALVFGKRKYYEEDTDVPYYIGFFAAILKNLVDLGISLRPACIYLGGCFVSCWRYIFPPSIQIAPANNAANASQDLSMNDSLSVNSDPVPARVNADGNADNMSSS